MRIWPLAGVRFDILLYFNVKSGAKIKASEFRLFEESFPFRSIERSQDMP